MYQESREDTAQSYSINLWALRGRMFKHKNDPSPTCIFTWVSKPELFKL